MDLKPFDNIEEPIKFFKQIGYQRCFSTIIGIIKKDWKVKTKEEAIQEFITYWNEKVQNPPIRPTLRNCSIGYILTIYLINEIREPAGAWWVNKPYITSNKEV